MSGAGSSGAPLDNRAPQVSLMRTVKPPGLHRFLGPALILLAAALATAPILLHGSFCGDDSEFHAISWFDFQQSWLHGIPYPHWLSAVNYGAGEPRFIFYPPLTWMLGAALGFVLPWPLVPSAMIFLVLAATGFATRSLALEVLSDAPATLAGCASLFSGYALFTAYERTAFAELTGGFWIPMVLMFAMRDRNPSGRLWRRALDGSALPLALVLAGAWLSDGPVGVMASYLLAALALTASILERSWAPILRGSIAAVLGIALPAIYLIPAAWEQHWVDLRAAINLPVFNIENNWLFAHHTDPALAPFAMVLHRASMLNSTMIAVALLSALAILLRLKFSSQNGPEVRSRAFNSASPPRRWWITLALIPVVVLFLQFPISLPVWNLLPELRFLQYPWRWTLVVEAPMAIFFSAALWPSKSARRWQRAAVAALCAVFFVTAATLAARTFLRVCSEGDTMTDLLTAYRSGGGVEGTDEYEAPDSDHWKIPTGLPDACFSADSDTTLGISTTQDAIPTWQPDQGSCEATATAQLRQSERMRIATVTPHAGYLILRLLSYPAWHITVNGQPTGPLDPRDDGLIAVPVPKGPVDLAVDWTTTRDVVVSRWLSSSAILLLLVLGLLERKLYRPRSS
jgi:hypothetical protein